MNRRARLDGCEGDRSRFALRACNWSSTDSQAGTASVIGLCLTPRCCAGGFAKLVARDVEKIGMTRMRSARSAGWGVRTGCAHRRHGPNCADVVLDVLHRDRFGHRPRHRLGDRALGRNPAAGWGRPPPNKESPMTVTVLYPSASSRVAKRSALPHHLFDVSAMTSRMPRSKSL